MHYRILEITEKAESGRSSLRMEYAGLFQSEIVKEANNGTYEHGYLLLLSLGQIMVGPRSLH